MEYVNGVEIGGGMEVEGARMTVHILGYFFRDDAPRIRAHGEKSKKTGRMKSAAALKGFEKMGIPITEETIEAAYPGRLSLWAMRKLLLEGGTVSGKPEGEKLVAEAVKLGASGAEFPPSPTAEDILDILKSDGATTFMAHPFWLTKPSRGGWAEELVRKQMEVLRALGVDGFEVVNSANDAGHADEVLGYCKEHNLPGSGRSDSHGAKNVARHPVDARLLRSIKDYRNGKSRLWD